MSLMLLSNCDCIVRILAPCHLYDGNTTGSGREFSTQSLIVCCDEGKMCLSVQFLIWKKCSSRKCLAIPQSLSATHSHWHGIHVISVRREGRAGSTAAGLPTEVRTVVESGGQSRDGLSHVVSERRFRGDDDGPGIFFHNVRRADTSSAVSYIFKHSSSNTSST